MAEAHEFLALEPKRQRGWLHRPVAVYEAAIREGRECGSCGVAHRMSPDNLRLQRKGLKGGGAWLPHDPAGAYCVDPIVASHIRERGFSVTMREIYWGASEEVAGYEILLPTPSPTPWYDETALDTYCHSERTGHAGSVCPMCGTRKWHYVGEELLPAPDLKGVERLDVIASPEWFGSGGLAIHCVLFSRALAEVLVRASPRDFRAVIPGGAWTP